MSSRTLAFLHRQQSDSRCRAGHSAVSLANPRQPIGVQRLTNTKAQAHREQSHGCKRFLQLFQQSVELLRREAPGFPNFPRCPNVADKRDGIAADVQHPGPHRKLHKRMHERPHVCFGLWRQGQFAEPRRAAAARPESAYRPTSAISDSSGNSDTLAPWKPVRASAPLRFVPCSHAAHRVPRCSALRFRLLDFKAFNLFPCGCLGWKFLFSSNSL